MPFCKKWKEGVSVDSDLDCGDFDGRCGKCPNYDPRTPTIADLIPVGWIPTTQDMKWDCVRCGECCRREGNFLELTIEEYVKGLNRFFPPRFVEDEYTRIMIMAGSYISFEDDPQGCQRCIWLGGGECLIYDRRPKTCQIYPFQIYNALDPNEAVYIDTRCKGFGQGRPIYKPDGELRPDVWRMKHITLPMLVSELIETVRVSKMLLDKKALKLLPMNSGIKRGYFPVGQVIMSFADDDHMDEEITYNLLPPKNQNEWEKRVDILQKRHELKAVKESQ